MKFRPDEIRRRAQHAMMPAVGVSLLAYFAYHAIEGDRGLLAWQRLDGRIAETRAALAEAKAKREVLEHRVHLMRSQTLDPDLLEERVRAVLGLVGAEDRIVLESSARVGR